MGKFIDMAGQKFGRWTAIEYLGKSKWRCKCECGVEKELDGIYLRMGESLSCGCLKRELAKSRATIHGLSANPLYKMHSDMLIRCTSEKNKHYVDYGGRGISVCEEWADKEGGLRRFVEWGGKENGYEEGLQIDREDNDGNYDPSNCRFVTPLVNVLNRRAPKSNTSGYVGVGWHKALSKWQSRVTVDRKGIHLGYFSTKKQAVEARNNYIKQNNLEHKLQEYTG